MAGKYDEEVATALELLTEFGQACQLIPPGVPIDAAKPWSELADGTPLPCIAVLLDSTRPAQGPSGTGPTVRYRRALIAASGLSVVPGKGYRLVDKAGRQYQVDELTKDLAPDGQHIYFECEVIA